MNVYDFDKTIFYPDSSCCFYIYCLRKYPFAVLKTLPKTAVMALKYICREADTRQMKQQLFTFLKYISDPDRAAEEFWSLNFKRIGKWYLEQKKADDLIISASPEFMLKPAAARLGVALIGTRMDKSTGEIWGKNCHDTEKVCRFREIYGDAKIEEFYSDSLSDSPLADIADKAFIIKKGKISAWPI